ncbi:cytochrome b [Defluviimonas sp. SAOS-178_SWC]|uniref:cytochrome b n=1 Tax=Defluviimonas sp. SAOS-178_SWC TaxID=3121287 RepID=UPI00322204C6
MTATPSSRHGYDRVARSVHWLTALAVVAAIGIGLTMIRLPGTTEDEVARVFRAYSLHKTIGLAVLGLAVLRVAWTLRHPGPGPLHPERRVETCAARLVHFTLVGGLLVLPISGLLRHSASPGFAPILWPFGQALPFVPADERLALVFASVHEVGGWLLFAALGLHILGVAKHQILDRDATLRRMLTGAGPAVAPAGRGRTAPLAAAGLWAAALLAGYLLAPAPEPDPFDALGPAGEIEVPAPPAD